MNNNIIATNNFEIVTHILCNTCNKSVPKENESKENKFTCKECYKQKLKNKRFANGYNEYHKNYYHLKKNKPTC